MVAYVRKPYRPRKYGQQSTRSIRNARSHVVNKPVRTIQKKKYVPKVTKNTQSITTLARQVRKLQVSQLGLFQKRIEQVNLSAISGSDMQIGPDRPFCFMLNDFTSNAAVWHPKDDNHLVNSQFALFQYPTVLEEKYDFWQSANDDIVSSEVYQPIRTMLQFEITETQVALNIPRWVRIDFITLKRTLPFSDERIFQMPLGINGLGNLANNSMLLRNRYNPTYHKVLQTRWVKLNRGDYDTKARAFCTMKHTFPAKQLRVDKQPSGNEYAHFMIPSNEQIWCIISTSAGHLSENAAGIDITLKRTLHWRDPTGVAT